jgi:hypothetical protein
MKVSKAIEMLSKYNKPDDEIVIAWFDYAGTNENITENQWETLVHKIDNELDEECWSGASDFIYGLVDEVEEATLRAEDTARNGEQL